MDNDGLFLTPITDALDLAVDIAREALDGAPGAAAEKAYEAEFERLGEETGLTLDEIDQIGAPKTAIGRLFERIQDWWWDKTSGAEDVLGEGDEAILETVFAFPVPLLRTRPLQDTALEYAEVDQRFSEATADIVAAISQRTGWMPASLREFESDEDVFDPIEQILAVWKTETTSALLVLVDALEEDPKLMGHSLGLVHLVGKPASIVAARLQ